MGRFYDKIIDGSVAEWLKAHDSKSCGPLRVSEVRILSLPPQIFGQNLFRAEIYEGSEGDTLVILSLFE
jgi:hypothetical protein